MKNMKTFAELVERVRKLTIDEIEELTLIIKREKIDRGRKSILRNSKKSKKELAEGKLTFSSDINFLKKQLGLK
jgi:hypothetical protein